MLTVLQQALSVVLSVPGEQQDRNKLHRRRELSKGEERETYEHILKKF
jgi:hypothetical protein